MTDRPIVEPSSRVGAPSENEAATGRCSEAPGSAPISAADVLRLVGGLSAQAVLRSESAKEMADEDDTDGSFRAGLRHDAKVFEFCACVLAAHAAEMPNADGVGRRDGAPHEAAPPKS